MDEKQQKKTKDENKNEAANNYVRYSSMSFRMIIIILLGAFGGRQLDIYFNFDKPYLTLACSLLAVAVAMFILIKELTR